jgi:hypothetical protein
MLPFTRSAAIRSCADLAVGGVVDDAEGGGPPLAVGPPVAVGPAELELGAAALEVGAEPVGAGGGLEQAVTNAKAARRVPEPPFMRHRLSPV